MSEYSRHIFFPDTRDPGIGALERNIQQRALNKDKKFKPEGTWKELIRQEKDLKIFRVDSEWIRNNLLVSWNHGGHGYVCEFIPIDEIWIGDTHPDNCECQGVYHDRHISPRFFESCVLHETLEWNLMAGGMIYWQAHQLALDAEIKAGYIVDGYTEDYRPL